MKLLYTFAKDKLSMRHLASWSELNGGQKAGLLTGDTEACGRDPYNPGLVGGQGLDWGSLWLAATHPIGTSIHSFVGHFKSRREREAELGARALEFTNIYVKNLRVDVDEQGLQDLFSQFGGRVPQCRQGPIISSLLPVLARRQGREVRGGKAGLLGASQGLVQGGVPRRTPLIPS